MCVFIYFLFYSSRFYSFLGLNLTTVFRCSAHDSVSFLRPFFFFLLHNHTNVSRVSDSSSASRLIENRPKFARLARAVRARLFIPIYIEFIRGTIWKRFCFRCRGRTTFVRFDDGLQKITIGDGGKKWSAKRVCCAAPRIYMSYGRRETKVCPPSVVRSEGFMI